MQRSRTFTASWVIAGRDARSSTVDSRLRSNPGGRELGDIGPHLIRRQMDVYPHFPAFSSCYREMGRVTLTVVPDWLELTSIRPEWRLTMSRAIARPRPLPVEFGPFTNLSKTCGLSSAGIPSPVSATET